MVTGTTRQVVVVHGVEQDLYEQAIFLVRDDAIRKGGVTEEALLQQVRRSCRQALPGRRWLEHLLYGLLGAGITGCLWALTAFFF